MNKEKMINDILKEAASLTPYSNVIEFDTIIGNVKGPFTSKSSKEYLKVQFEANSVAHLKTWIGKGDPEDQQLMKKLQDIVYDAAHKFDVEIEKRMKVLGFRLE